MINPLTSLRFFASLAVYLHHLGYSGGMGDVAVNFFFVLSGFILAYNYKNKFSGLTKSKVIDFFANRVGRIYPLHVLTFLLSLPLIWVGAYHGGFVSGILNIFLLQTYAPIGIHVFDFNSVSWSISDEMFFYALFPFLIYALNKTIVNRNTTWTIIAAIVLFVLSWTIAMPFRHHMAPYTVGWWFIYVFPPYRAFSFFTGILLGYAFLYAKDKIRANIILFTAVELVSLVAFVLSFQSHYLKSASVADELYLLPSMCAIIFVFSFQAGVLSRVLSNRILVRLGDISYTIYMIHQLAITYAAVYFSAPIYQQHNYGYGFNKTVAQLILFIFVIALSDVLHRYIETPVRNVIRNRVRAALTKSRQFSKLPTSTLSPPPSLP